VLVVVANDKVLGEAALLDAPSRFGEGLLYLFRAHVSPLFVPLFAET
jgi:hypothetical protein